MILLCCLDGTLKLDHILLPLLLQCVQLGKDLLVFGLLLFQLLEKLLGGGLLLLDVGTHSLMELPKFVGKDLSVE